MTLETLKGVKKINGFNVVDDVSNPRHWYYWDESKECRMKYPIKIDNEKNTISFKIQDGLIKEVGVNGCQVNEIGEVFMLMIIGLDKNIPCDENKKAIAHIDAALAWLKQRKKDREKRGVEGYNKE